MLLRARPYVVRSRALVAFTVVHQVATSFRITTPRAGRGLNVARAAWRWRSSTHDGHMPFGRSPPGAPAPAGCVEHHSTGGARWGEGTFRRAHGTVWSANEACSRVS